MLVNELEELYNNLNDIQHINYNQVESLCSKLIISDYFDQLPNNLKDSIYLFDMHEIEKIDQHDIDQAKKMIDEYISKIK